MTETLTQTLSMFAVKFSPLVGGFILVIWIGAEIKKRVDRARLDRQTGPDSIAALSWNEFETLLAEAFRRRGFEVDQTGGPRPDGGVDLRLSKAGAVTLVQCKHWNDRSVGVKIIRELRGVVASENAHSGIVVTSGRYTADATAFAATNPIRLIDGQELCRMIAEVRKPARTPASPPSRPTSRPSPERAAGASLSNKSADSRRSRPPHGQLGGTRERAAPPVSPSPHHATTSPPVAPACPNCGSNMVERIARTGKNAGSPFLGCSQYPNCRGTRDIKLRGA